MEKVVFFETFCGHPQERLYDVTAQNTKDSMDICSFMSVSGSQTVVCVVSKWSAIP
jgi:hypothetical protein